MRAHFGLPSVKSGVLNPTNSYQDLTDIHFLEQDMDKRAPITVKFEIPYFTVSGIQVRYLKIVEKSGYQALPWVRYITQNGDDYRYAPLFHGNAELTCVYQFANGFGERKFCNHADVDHLYFSPNHHSSISL